VALGVVVAVVLLASAPLYSTVLNDLGLRYTLQRETPGRSEIQVQISGKPSDPGEYQNARSAIEKTVSSSIGSLAGTLTRYGHSASFFVFRPGQNIPGPGQVANNQPRGYVQFSDGVAKKLNISSGTWPAAASNGVIPALAGKEGADEIGLKVGDQILLSPVTGGQPVTVQIAAIGEPNDPEDQFWAIGAIRLVDQARDWSILPMIVDESQYFPAAAAASSDYVWTWPIDTASLTTENAAGIRDATAGLRASLPTTYPGSTVVTALDSFLSDYLSKLATCSSTANRAKLRC
jgi:hypothetical protein